MLSGGPKEREKEGGGGGLVIDLRGTVFTTKFLTPSSYRFCMRLKYLVITSSMGQVEYTEDSQKHWPMSLTPIQTATSRSSAVHWAYEGAGTKLDSNSPTWAMTSVVTPVLMISLDTSAP